MRDRDKGCNVYVQFAGCAAFWHLSPNDKKELESYWETSADNAKAKQVVHDFLAATGTTTSGEMAAPCKAL